MIGENDERQGRAGAQDTAPGDAAPADAAPGNWVDRWAPAPARPYLRLARADRPIGVWLLLWPCWWSSALASLSQGADLPNLGHLALFAVGAMVMRAAGCTYNDIVDRDIDARVARTRGRPIPSGAVSVAQAAAFMVALSLVGLLVLLQFNRFTIGLGIASLAPIAIYPFMKRITHWPQLVLGLTFNWGALMGWAAIKGSLDAPALLLYAGAVAWTVGYDTIYAHQDREDDALLGLKSTALRFGAASDKWVAAFYALAWSGIFAAGWMAGGRVVFATAMALAAMHMAWQVATLDTDDPDNCLARFRANRDLGAIVFAGLVLDMAVRALVTG